MTFPSNCRNVSSAMAHHFTTTHGHDFRWPHSTCLIPKAEAPNDHCEWSGEVGDKPWCKRDAPSPPPRSKLEPSRACADVAPIADRPWCQRGPLVPCISPRTSTPAVLKVRPDDCPAKYLSQELQRSGHNGFNRVCQVPTRQRLGPEGCYENNESSLRQHLQKNGCYEPNPINKNPRMEPRSCFSEFAASRNDVNAGMGPAGCYEEPVPPRLWCEQDMIASVRVGAAPQQDTSRYNQPNQYLQQLCDKYPKPTAVVLATPRDELMRRVYADRYRTTYQTDYCKNGDSAARLLVNCDNHDPGQKFNGQDRLAPEDQFTNCRSGCRKEDNTYFSSVKSAGDFPTPSLHPPTCRPAPVSHNVHFSCCYTTKQKQAMQGKAISGNESVGPPEKLPPWISEYSDSIGRTGQVIINQKLLYPKRKKNKC